MSHNNPVSNPISLAVAISPSGVPCLYTGDDGTPSTLAPAAAKRIEAAFQAERRKNIKHEADERLHVAAYGMLHLATAELSTTLPNDLDYLRSFGRDYLSRLCHQTLGESESVAPVPPPNPSVFEFLALAVPPMRGAEYVNPDVLSEWWYTLDHTVRSEIATHPAGVADWLQKGNPVWRTVGRVTFHLAENKRDESYPFAFLATYTEKITRAATPKQLKLADALQQYAGEKNRDGLLRLFQPITAAAEQIDWVREMVDAETIYHPRAWTAKQARQLLQDIPRLEGAGLLVRVPDWWKANKPTRPTVKVNIGEKDKRGLCGAESLMEFQVSTVLGGETLTPQEINELLKSDDGLVRLRGEWVEVDKEQLAAALDHWKKVDQLVAENGLTFFQAMRLLSGMPLDSSLDGTPEEVAARRWAEVAPTDELAKILAAMRDPAQLDANDAINDDCTNEKLIGLNAELRPYQKVGVRWLGFLSRLGLGACLADDMGLGKTIQVIAILLQRKRNQRAADVPQTPSLLVAPASLLANWESEIKRFAPSLTTHIAHASGAGQQEPTKSELEKIDLLITTYAMAQKLEWLANHRFPLLILDEAQAIKNAGAKQTKSIKTLNADSRIVLTGTPMENRLSDLWSLFDFLNPGLLGTARAFSQFVKALQRQSDSGAYIPLRKLVQPYILRRLKSDKRIIDDLPDKTEVYAYCSLSKPQLVLYKKSVDQLTADLNAQHDDKNGIKRRGVILAYLMRFKQICNHPSQWTGDGGYDPADSGKFDRLRELAEEIAERQEKLLVFTQFREITSVIANFLQPIFHKPGLILDGSTAVAKRRGMVELFQSETGSPFFVLSLKAGGTGLNLTAASHVIHFDRWWNPAVENQATDRAFRIGQKKNVLVHKFMCRGTIEEKIDQLIESKKSLAEQIVEGGGEQLLTEMSDADLLNFVALDIDKVVV